MVVTPNAPTKVT